MKLILCPHCGDIRNLKFHKITCECGKSGGIYTDDVNAIIYGDAIPIGFANWSFRSAVRNRPKKGRGLLFEAFIIAEQCRSITKNT